MEKVEIYKLLCAQIEALIEGEDNKVGVLANVSAAINDAFGDRLLWTGFYLVSDGELKLGPFQGPVACYHIKKGKGVCGSAWEDGRVIVVPNVDEFPGHIACSSLSKSEIVVPLFGEEHEVWGVLDIDSCDLNAFDEVDAAYLEKIGNMLSRFSNL